MFPSGGQRTQQVMESSGFQLHICSKVPIKAVERIDGAGACRCVRHPEAEESCLVTNLHHTGDNGWSGPHRLGPCLGSPLMCTHSFSSLTRPAPPGCVQNTNKVTLNASVTTSLTLEGPLCCTKPTLVAITQLAEQRQALPLSPLSGVCLWGE